MNTKSDQAPSSGTPSPGERGGLRSLLLLWRGRRIALRAITEKSGKNLATEVEIATYDECIDELEAALAARAQPEPVAFLRDHEDDFGAVETDLCDERDAGAYPVYRAAPSPAVAMKALEPFAREADTHGEQIPDQMKIWDYEGPEGGKNDLTIGDLRRARTALLTIRGGKHE